jgi:hypothetical protein
MGSPLPDALLEADRALHRMLEAVRFSRHLNPVNVPEARAAFLAGADVPPFVYAPATWADDLLAALAALRIPRAHPLGEEVGRVADGVALLARALRDRTPEAFEALATHAGWWPTARALSGELPALPAADVAPDDLAAVPRADVPAALRAALRARGWEGWTVLEDPAMSARVLVAAPQREIRIAPHARFRRRDLRALVAHEIDVHVARARAGEAQPLHVFATGLHGALATEEGLALLAEARVGALPREALARQVWVGRAVQLARRAGFREVHDALLGPLEAHGAWSVALRVKRGLADPGAAGVYAKDTVYLEGLCEVHDALAADPGALAWLYAGKVSTRHPLTAWADHGWIRAGAPPALWAGAY